MDQQDHISDLPIDILHDILSRLRKRKYAVMTSVLSKKWAETWSTFPILSFDDAKIMSTFPEGMGDPVSKRKCFLDYVRNTLLSFHDRGLAIKEFSVRVNYFDQQYIYGDVDLWMKLVTESSVQELNLYLDDDSYDGKEYEKDKDHWYIFPKDVLEANSLKDLFLVGRIRIDQELMDHSIKFFSLRELSLWYILLGDEQAIDRLVSHCPLLESISLLFCHVLKPGNMTGPLSSISMRGLPKLKSVQVIRTQEVYIDAPNLQELDHIPSDFHTPCKIDFDRCRNLRRLLLSSLAGTIITDKWFLELFIKFPFLERLRLSRCTMSEKINISSGQLKFLSLAYCSNLEEAYIDAPNLLSCHVSSPDLCNVRKLIQNFKPENVLTSLSLSINDPIMEDAWNPDVLQLSSPPPPSIEQLDLNVAPKDTTFYLLLVYGLLSSCRPATISLTLRPFCSNRAFIEFFYEKLIDKKEEGCFCSSSHTKCWWHSLKDVKVKVMSDIKTDEDVDFKTRLNALETCADEKKISFMLEF